MAKDEYHRVAEDLPEGMVKTRCGKVVHKSRVYGPGRSPCRMCWREEREHPGGQAGQNAMDGYE